MPSSQWPETKFFTASLAMGSALRARTGTEAAHSPQVNQPRMAPTMDLSWECAPSADALSSIRGSLVVETQRLGRLRAKSSIVLSPETDGAARLLGNARPFGETLRPSELINL